MGTSRPPQPVAPALRDADRPLRSRQLATATLIALPAWLVARVLVAGALIGAHLGVSTLRPHNAAAVLRVHQGLLAWDGGWYESIARHGYATAGVQSVRFYPAFPLAGRLVGHIPGIGPGPALVAIANLSSLAAMAGVVLLVRHDFGDGGLARRSAWLLGLAPSAYSLVLGYADGPLLLCTVTCFLGARTQRWWWAAGAGLAAGLVRPVGILVVIPVVVEVWRQHRAAPGGGVGAAAGEKRTGRSALAQGSAIAAPLVGTAIFLVWVRAQFGDLWLPFRLQQQGGHRGSLTLPLTSMWHNLVSVAHGHHLGSASHIPWAIVAVALVVVAFRRLPLSYGLFAAAVVVVSLASSNLDSFERYALGAFPLVVAASTLTSRRGVETVVLVVSAAAMTGYALLAFLGVVVP